MMKNWYVELETEDGWTSSEVVQAETAADVLRNILASDDAALIIRVKVEPTEP